MLRPWFIPKDVEDEIRHFPPHLKWQVRKAMDEIRLNPETGKSLIEDLEGYRSCRIGSNRLIYKIENTKLILVSVGPRRGIYEKMVLEMARSKIKERAARYHAKTKKKIRVVV